METEAKTQQRNHVIRKRGYFYRPNAQGYCADVRDAGRWTLDEAMRMISHMAPGEAHVFHISDFPATQTQPTPGLTPLEEEMLAALRPFAIAAAVLDDGQPAEQVVLRNLCGWPVVLLDGDFRRARAAITKAESLKAQAAKAENADQQS